SGEREPALTGRMGQRRVRQKHELLCDAVDGDGEAGLHLGFLAGEHRGGREAALLERRDLGLVEEVVKVDPVGCDAHRHEMIDREVYEGVCARGGRGNRQHGDEREEHATETDDSAPRARGAYSGLKCGLSTSARWRYALAAARSPTALAAMPAW